MIKVIDAAQQAPESLRQLVPFPIARFDFS